MNENKKWKVQHRWDTAANWRLLNPVLLAGEKGIVSDSPNNKREYRVGDGKTPWNDLPASFDWDGKFPEVPTRLDEMAEDARHRTVTDEERNKWNSVFEVEQELGNSVDRVVSQKTIYNNLKLSRITLLNAEFNRVVSEIIINGLDKFNNPLEIQLYKEGRQRQFTLFEVVAGELKALTSYYADNVDSDKSEIIELRGSAGHSDITGYVLIDFSKQKSRKITVNVEKSDIDKEWLAHNINLLKTYKLLYGYIFHYTTDVSFNNAVKEIFFEGLSRTEKDIKLLIQKNGKIRQVALFVKDSAVSSYYTESITTDELSVIAIPEFKGSGIKGYIYIDFTKVPDGKNNYYLTADVLTNKSYSPFLQVYIESVKPKGFWGGKKLLAIGDSIVAAGKWQEYVGRKLGMKVRTHAKGGIGIIEMVDGSDGSIPPNYDPDDFGTGLLYPLDVKDVEGVDVIVIMGFYNNAGEASSNKGNKEDMYPSQSTFIGKLNYAIKRIFDTLKKANNKSCKVVVCSAHKYGRNEWRDKSAYVDGDALIVATRESSNYNSTPFIDLMCHGGINRYNWNDFGKSDTPYNPNYIPKDGINDGTDKPFASLAEAPTASSSNGKYITIAREGTYKSNGSSWIKDSVPYPWNADQLHLNDKGYEKIGDYIAGFLNTL